MTLESRLDRVSRQLDEARPLDCQGPTTLVVYNEEPIPPNPPLCKRCKQPHIVRITEEIVISGDSQ